MAEIVAELPPAEEPSAHADDGDPRTDDGIERLRRGFHQIDPQAIAELLVIPLMGDLDRTAPEPTIPPVRRFDGRQPAGLPGFSRLAIAALSNWRRSRAPAASGTSLVENLREDVRQPAAIRKLEILPRIENGVDAVNLPLGQTTAERRAANMSRKKSWGS